MREARGFSVAVRRAAWAACGGHCQHCTAPITGAGDAAYDHVVPWALTRDSSIANCQVLCRACHGAKTSRQDVPQIAKAVRQSDGHHGVRGPGLGRCPMPCGRHSARRRTIKGRVVTRLTQAELHVRAMRARYCFTEDAP